MPKPTSQRTIFDHIDREKKWLSDFEAKVMAMLFEPCTAKARDKALLLHQQAHKMRRAMCELEDYLDQVLVRALGCHERAMEACQSLNEELHLLKYQCERDRAA